MFAIGDRVAYVGKRSGWKGREWIVRRSALAQQYRGGGYCSFYEQQNLNIAWANLKLVTSFSLENK